MISNPSNPRDELDRAVLLLITHTESTGIALQVNSPYTEVSLASLCRNLGIEYVGAEPLYYGGNISINKIHVVHSLDWRGLSTVPLTKNIGITQDISVLTAISQGDGPRYFKACTGYWIWEEGRLDIQLDARNNTPTEPHKWEIVPATLDNVFRTESDAIWEDCLAESARQKVDSWF
jgi:putative transcriptional regulator